MIEFLKMPQLHITQQSLITNYLIITSLWTFRDSYYLLHGPQRAILDSHNCVFRNVGSTGCFCNGLCHCSLSGHNDWRNVLDPESSPHGDGTHRPRTAYRIGAPPSTSQPGRGVTRQHNERVVKESHVI